MAEFEITACHADRAGHASVSLKDLTTGAVVMIHHMTFDHDYGETVQHECDRIQSHAGDICARAMAFLKAPAKASDVHPDHAPAAAPQPSDPANPFDQDRANSH